MWVTLAMPLMPVSLSGVSGTFACPFGTVIARRALICPSRVGQQKVRTGSGIRDSASQSPRVRKLPPRCRHAPTLQAWSFCSYPFRIPPLPLLLEFCFLTPDFSFIFLFRTFSHAFDTLKIPAHRSELETRDIFWKKWFDWTTFRKLFFSCYANFTWIQTHKTHDLTDDELTVGSFLPAIALMRGDRRIPGWSQFFQPQLFPFLPSLADFDYFSKFPPRSSMCKFGHATHFIPF